MKIIEVGFENSYEMIVCYEEDMKDILKSNRKAYIVGEKKQCEACGKRTNELTILHKVARCIDCHRKYLKNKNRLSDYRYI